MKKLLIAVALAGAMGATAVPSFADTIIVRTAPPPPRTEAIPDARHGYTWVEGHWDWNGRRYVWIRGKWIRDRPGYVYHPQTWEERDGRWVAERGRWGRGDRDHDGIPNRYDRDRDNDGIPNRYDRDRDNDGVPNRADAQPNNPRRY
ncbi:BcpO-related WXXGXW repeat protein [Duganella sp. FT92W]|uniref:BcpO-related WXXGXW repeat protein n=1 Tax=Pseudoduganella rivuli TaxID=2666085 RepID=A0A7X2IVS1_9BURK|nr:YXWGXW repeat-containing protein [Pseudoduganella rivuli]MRV76835.1 BcpO-related WXXGXW repeat protein [Pseudoduganella rivuli]